jgi:hypothetical protein
MSDAGSANEKDSSGPKHQAEDLKGKELEGSKKSNAGRKRASSREPKWKPSKAPKLVPEKVCNAFFLNYSEII